MNATTQTTHGGKAGELRLGFLPLTDCAPMVAAHELGLFAQHGLNVTLERERDWIRLRDRLVHGELDAIHAPATMPFTLQFGMDCPPFECVTGLILSLQGNAITLSKQLGERGITDARTLRREVFRLFGRRTLTFGVPIGISTHTLLLRRWLKSARIEPDIHVRIISLPPIDMFPNMKLGNLDGFCVGEPWSSVTADAGVGFCVATSAELAPLHPEKVLLVSREFAEKRAPEHLRLIAALRDACAFCDQPANWTFLRRLLATPRYVDAPEDCLLNALQPPADPEVEKVPAFHESTFFHRYNANEPTAARAIWVVRELIESGLVSKFSAASCNGLREVFRPDIYAQASRLKAREPRRAVNA